MARSGVDEFTRLYRAHKERTNLFEYDYDEGVYIKFTGIPHDLRVRKLYVYEKEGKVVLYTTKKGEYAKGGLRPLHSVRMTATQAWEFVQARFPPRTRKPNWEAIIAVIRENRFVEVDAHNYLKELVDKDTLTAALLDATLRQRIHDACQY